MNNQAYQPPGVKRPLSLLAASVLLCLYGAPVRANPAGPVIAHGRVDIDAGAPGRLNVTNSPNAIINWRDFSVGRNEVTRFIQQSADSAVLNRVVGSDPSAIMGQLLSNGRVYLINPNGIIFGQHAVVDTAGFLASTLDISDNDFLKGNYVFTSRDAQGIENHGLIHTGKDGNIVLIAPDIKNDGVLHSEGGKITLAAGRELTISSLDAPEVSFKIQAPGDKVLNLGRMLADGGGAVRVFASTLTNSGEISADSMRMDAEGNIVLEAKDSVTLTAQSEVHANGVSGGNVRVESLGGQTLVSGSIDAKGTVTLPLPLGKPPQSGITKASGEGRGEGSGGAGGNIQLLGRQVGLLDGAQVDASGATDGGTVLVGGDYQGANPAVQNAQASYVAPTATLKADAGAHGDGGKVIVWSDKATRAHGHLSARGGRQGGDGGLIETSGHWLDTAGIKIDAAAPHGRGGEWLLDPFDLTVSNAATSNTQGTPGSPYTFSALAAGSNVSSADIETQLNSGTSVTLQTSGTAGDGWGNGDIAINANIAKTAGGPASLLFKAHNSIILAGGVGISSSVGALDVTFNSDSDHSLAGAIQLNAGSSIASNGGNITLGGGADPSAYDAYGTAANPHGISLTGATLNAGGGNIRLRGYGYGALSGSDGVHVEGGSISGSGYINLWGWGGPSQNNSRGLYILNNAQITGSGGSIDLKGDSQGATGSFKDGVLITAGSGITNSGGGSITITGGGRGSDHAPGVAIADNNTLIQTANGDLTITGETFSTGTGSYGVLSWSATPTIRATGSGHVSITGTGGNGGISLSATTLQTNSGALSLTADSIGWDAAVVLQGAGALSLQPAAGTSSIGVAGGAGTFNLDVTELGRIQDGFSSIKIGQHNGTGTLTFGDGAGAGSGYTFQDPLILRGGDIVVDDALATGSGALLGSLTLHANNDITLGNSLTTQAQAVTLNADADASGAGAIVLNSGSSISSNGGGITLGGGADPISGFAQGHSGYYDGVYLAGSLSANGGNILVNGNADAVSNSGADKHGIFLAGSGLISTTGFGSITLTGQSLNQPASGASAIGVTANGGISSQNGDIQINGTSGDSNNSMGVGVHNSAAIVQATGGGNVTLSGTAGGAANANASRGIVVSAGGVVRTNSGTLTLDGVSTAISTSNEAAGVNIRAWNGGATVDSTTGAINVQGTAVAGVGKAILVDSSASAASRSIGNNTSGDILLDAKNGTDIVLTGADIKTTGNITLNAEGGGDITQSGGYLQAAGLRVLGDAASTVTLNSSSNDVATLAVDLPDAGSVVNYTDSGAFDIGALMSDKLGSGTSTTTNGLTVGTAGSTTLTAGAAVTQSQAMTTDGLELLGSGSYTLANAENRITTVAGNTSGAINLSDSTSLTVGTVGGTAGLTALGSITLNSTAGINVNALLKTGLHSVGVSTGNSGSISLTAGGNIQLGITGTAIDTSIWTDGNGTTTGNVGDVSLTAAGGISGASSNISAWLEKYQYGGTGSRAGNITLTANGGDISVGNLTAHAYQNDSGGTVGNGGNVSATASGAITVTGIDTRSYGALFNAGTTTIGNGGNVSLTANNGSVTVNGAVDAQAYHGGYYLGNFYRNGTATVGQGGTITLRADAGGSCLYNSSSCATVVFGGGGSAASSGTGRTDIYYNPVSYANPTNYSVTGSNTAWMLVNDVGTESGGTRGLQAMNANPAGNYALGKNIDAGATSTWDGGAGFLPVGNASTSFTGKFDGLNNVITDLTINRPATDYVGLFGVTGAGSAITRVGLLGGGTTGHNYVGALVGSNNGDVSYTYATGDVAGAGSSGGIHIGGLVGDSAYQPTLHVGSISYSYASGDVTGRIKVGGLLGYQEGSTSYSYATGDVTAAGSGAMDAGGLLGANNSQGQVNYSYATGNVSAPDAAGGLVGVNYNSAASINYSFASGTATGTSNVGALVGQNGSGGSTGVIIGSAALSGTAPMTQSTYTDAGWNFTTDWWMSEGNTRPFLRSEWSNTINNAHQLQLMSMNPAANYSLGRDIDMVELTQTSGLWDTSKGFVPVGDGDLQSLQPRFTGNFDGQDHSITGLTINRPATDYAGLFGSVALGSSVTHLRLAGGNIAGQNYVGAVVGENIGSVEYVDASAGVTGNNYVGGLVGSNVGAYTVSHASASGTVTGVSYVGGLVGDNTGAIDNSYALGHVTGSIDVGGLVGSNGGTIDNSYAAGLITSGGGNDVPGGLIGQNTGTISVRNSFWNTDTSGTGTGIGGGDTSTGATGMDTIGMMTGTNFTTATTANGSVNPNWNFSNIWGITANAYPYLQWRFPIAPQIVSGTLSNELFRGQTIQLAQDGTALATASTGSNGFYYQALDAGSIPSGHTLLAYQVGAGSLPAAAVRLSDGNSMTGLTLNGGALNVSSSNSTAISNSQLATAKGSLSSADIPYSAAGSNLTLTSGTAWQTAPDTNFTFDGNLTTQSAGQTWNGPLAMAADVTLTSGGSIVLAGSLTKTGSSDATLTLKAADSLSLAAGKSLTSSSGKLNVVFNADADGSGAGNIQLGAGSSIASNGGSIVMGGGSCSISSCSALNSNSTGAAMGIGTASLAEKIGIYLAGTSGAGNSVSLNSGGGAIWMKGLGLAGTSNASGIEIDNAGLQSGGGVMTLTGRGGAGGAIDVQNYGIALFSSSLNSGAGAMTLNGTGGSGSDENQGVYLSVDVTALTRSTLTTSGALNMTGVGGGTGFDNRGIRFKSATLSAGSMTLDGTGGNGTNYNRGIFADAYNDTLGGSSLTTTSGAMTLIGQGGVSATGTQNEGIRLSSTTLNSAGNLTLTGTGGGGTTYNQGVVIGVDSADLTVSSLTSGSLLSITGTGVGLAAGSDNRGIRLDSAQLDAATMTLSGTGGLGAGWNIGIYATPYNATLGGTRLTTTGAMTLTGQGGTAATGSDNDGILLRSSMLNSGAGTLTLNGTAGSGTSGNDGVDIDVDSGTPLIASMVTTSGALNITGSSPGNTSATDNSGIDLGSARLSAGSMTLIGTGGRGTNYNRGIDLWAENATLGGVQLTTAGAMSLTGQGGVSATGTDNDGISLGSSTLNSGTGNLTLSGTGGGGTDYNTGVYLYGSQLSSGGGALTVTGHGGNAVNLSKGVYLDSGASLNSGGGALSMLGVGHGSGTDNHGILTSGATLVSGAGSLTLDGRGAVAGRGLNFGSGTVIGAASGQSGAISLIADTASGSDSIQLAGATAPVVRGSGSGSLTLEPLNNATSIGLASGTGAFNLSTTELGYLQGFSSITIGKSSGSGAITFGSTGSGFTFSNSLTLRNPGTGSGGIAIDDALSVGANTLTLNTAGPVTQSAALTAGSLELLGSNAAYSLTHSGNSIGALAANVASLNLANSAALSIGSVGATTGITAGGSVLIDNTAGLTLNNAISSNASANAIVLHGASFTNNAGSTALAASKDRWLVWSGNPANDTRGGLTYDFKQYNASYGSSTVLGSGNGFLYTLAPSITPTLTGSVSRVYDGGNTATLAASNYGYSGAVDGDTITLGKPATGSYDDKNVGNNKPVTVNGISLESAGNGTATVYGYTLASTTASANIGAITPLALTLTGLSAASRVYNGTASAAVTGSPGFSGAVGNDDIGVAVSGALGASFADSSAGTGKTVTVSGISLSGADAGNYTLPLSLSADITPASLSIIANSTGKTYDGQAYSGGNGVTYSGFVNNETSSVLSGTLHYGGNSQGAVDAGSYAITPAGLSSGNYTISYVNGTLTIDPAPVVITTLSGSLTGTVSKVYDGTATASLSPSNFLLSGFLGGDAATVTKTTGSYSDADVGSGKTVSVTLSSADFSALGGTNLSNYSLPTLLTGAVGVITPASLSINGLTALNKVYDATTRATLSGGSLSGVFAGDTVTLVGGNASFADKNVGAGKAVTVSGFSLSGGDAGNYTLAQPAALSAAITPAMLNITGLSAVGKVYDATTRATLSGGSLSGVLAGDVVNLNNGSGSFADKNAGIGKTVSVSGFTLSGGDAGNYELILPVNLSADIAQASLRVDGLTALNKVYDATTEAKLNSGSLNGVLAGDVVTLNNGSGSFADKNAGIGKTVSVSGFTLSGGDAGNYELVLPVNLSADIA
ncbi:MAG: filamentous hemagglutinin N-terminal domain-containing protein, partial [Methylococcaceae bacterium]